MNEYIDTMKPILYLIKIIGISPLQWNKEDISSGFFLTSKAVTIIAMVVYMSNVFLVSKILYEKMNNLLLNFSLKWFLDFIPILNNRLLFYITPIIIWNPNTRRYLQDYWSSWREFQHKFEQISETNYFSKTKTRTKWVAVIVLLLNFLILFLGFGYFHAETIFILSEALLYHTIIVIPAYRITNYIYIRSVAQDLLELSKEVIIKGENNEKLNRVTALWLKLCELLEKFEECHSYLFVSFITALIIDFILICYVNLDRFFKGDSDYNVTHPVAWILSLVIIFSFCETSYLANKQLTFKLNEMLLQQDTARMNFKILHSVAGFLDTISKKNPKINLYGFLNVNRQLLPSIFAASINYLIILRQFSLD